MKNDRDKYDFSPFYQTEVFPRINELENKLGVKKDFFRLLLEEHEDDWSFVIKLHAILEAAVTHLLTEKVGKPELGDVFANLDMSTENKGRVAFLKALGLLDEYRSFIKLFSRIRNDYVHDVSNVTNRLEDYFEKNEEEKNTLIKQMNKVLKSPKNANEKVVSKTPAFALWHISVFILVEVYIHTPTPHK